MPPTCKGTKKDGTPCESKAVMANGYCCAHQDQAPPEPIDVSGPWTRERLEAAIEVWRACSRRQGDYQGQGRPVAGR